MRILVTGGAGFIGSHVVDAFVAAGHHVAVVDSLASGKRENLNPQATFYEVDVRDASCWRRCSRRSGPRWWTITRRRWRCGGRSRIRSMTRR